MYDYNARFYSAYLGRFISPDSVVPEPGNPQAFNRYSYVVNNPLKHIDPSGHCFASPADAAVCIAAGAGTGFSIATAAAMVPVGATVGLIVATSSEVVESLNTPETSLPTYENPWTETFNLETPSISVTPPINNTLGTQGPSIEAFPLPEVQPKTFGLEFPLLQSRVFGDNVVESTIYRGGGTNPGNLTPRPQDNGELSFRGSLSNPWPLPEGQRPPLPAGQPYFGVDTSKLPPGSVIYDDIPPGHVSVKDVPAEVVKDAIIEKGKFP